MRNGRDLDGLDGMMIGLTTACWAAGAYLVFTPFQILGLVALWFAGVGLWRLVYGTRRKP